MALFFAAAVAPWVPRAANRSNFTGTVFTTGCCGLGHRTSRLAKIYTYAASRNLRVVVDWGACVGTGVTNIFAELFEDSPSIAGNRESLLFYSSRCPQGACESKAEWVRRASPPTNPSRPTDGDVIFNNEPPPDWYPPGSGDTRLLAQKEWGLETTRPRPAPFAEQFATDLVSSLKEPFRSRLREFIDAEFRGIVLGVHFRLGNGEKFSRRPSNKTLVVLKAAAALREIARRHRGAACRVFVATDDMDALDILKQNIDLDVFARPQWRPPRGAGIVFSSWRLKHRDVADGDLKEQAHRDMVTDAHTCVSRSADMLIDAILLGYADAQLLTVPSTFTVLPRLIAYARAAPSCLFLHVNWNRLPTYHTSPLPLSCFRRIDKSHRLVTLEIRVPAGGRTTTNFFN